MKSITGAAQELRRSSPARGVPFGARFLPKLGRSARGGLFSGGLSMAALVTRGFSERAEISSAQA